MAHYLREFDTQMTTSHMYFASNRVVVVVVVVVVVFIASD